MFPPSVLSPKLLLEIYSRGLFPMSDPFDGSIEFFDPEWRAIILLESYRPSKSLRSVLRSERFEVRFNTCFKRVMELCRSTRLEIETWISKEMIQCYTELHFLGAAHSVEVFENKALVGGLYGVQIGGVFMGESMFHLVPNASKVAFHYLVEQLKKQQFSILDSQIINPFTASLGAIEIPREEFKWRLKMAIQEKRTFV
jgi:leucyl/phenylalanyl-tRNA---protein transferase